MPLPPPDRGPFLGFLDWVNSAGEVPLNLLRGRPGAAGRKLADFAGDTVDAAIPGDWIPHVSEEEDNVTASEAVGVDSTKNPVLAKATDFVLGTLTNPLSYVGLRGGAIKAGMPLTEGTAIPGSAAAISKAKDAYRGARDMLPDGVNETIDNSTHAVRKTLNWLDVPDDTMAALKQAKAEGYKSSRVGAEEIKRIYKGATDEERRAAAGGRQQIMADPNNAGKWMAIGDTPADMDNYINGLPKSQNLNPDVVRRLINEGQAKAGLEADELYSSGAWKGDRNAPKSYQARQFADDLHEESLFSPKGGGTPSPMKARNESMKTPAGLAKFMNETPGHGLEMDAMAADMGRATQQGRIVQKQHIAKSLEPAIVKSLKDKAAELDANGMPTEAARNAEISLKSLDEGISISVPEHKTLVQNAIDEVNKTNKDAAYALKTAWEGIAPRGDDVFSQSLHGANKLFKAGATSGALGIPRPGFTVRNRLANPTQTLTSDELRSSFFDNIKNIPRDLGGAFDDSRMAYAGANAKRWMPDDMSSALDHVESSFKGAGGDVNKLRQLIAQHPDGANLQGALDNGVFDSFVSAEGLLANEAKTARGQRWTEISNAPSATAQGAEHRMRYGAYLKAKDRGYGNAESARIARDINLDYDMAGVANRRFRDIVPFGAFLSQNAKQQSKFIVKHPVAAAAAGQLFSDDEQLPKYPWLERNISVPTGVDEKGNPTYLTSFGLPIEGMTSIPGFDQNDFYRDTIGQFQPLAKSAIAYAVDKDPFTGQRYGQYDKLFGEHMGEFGRIVNNIKGTGLIQPLAGPVGQAEQMSSDKTSTGEKALQYFTGARFVNVDPELAQQQKIEEYLAGHPEVKRSTQPYLTDDNQEMKDLIQQLRESKKRSRDQRKLAAGT